jgi:hypothetical protein
MSDERHAEDAAPGEDGWLTRFSAEEWLRAAQGELVRAEDALVRKQQRAGVAQARRAAGMAWNAVLVRILDLEERGRYGRSYMDHLRTLSDDTSVSAAVREAAGALLAAPLSSALVQLGKGDPQLAGAARVIVDEAARRVLGGAS